MATKRVRVEVEIEDECESGVAEFVRNLTRRLKESSDRLAAVVSASGGQITFTPQGDKIMASATSPEFQALSDQVTSTNGVEASAVVLITTLRQQIIDAGTDPAKLKALTDSMKASSDALAAAVAANP